MHSVPSNRLSSRGCKGRFHVETFWRTHSLSLFYESSRIFLGPEKPGVPPGKRRECRGQPPSAGVWGVPKYLFFFSRRRRRREKEKKREWGHPTPRQGEPCTPGCKHVFKSLG